MIRFEHVSRVFHNDGREFAAVNDVSLEIEKGEIFGIIGFSGAGKSTLVRCINLLERPTSGKVFIGDEELTAMSPAELRQHRKKIGMIFQQFNLFASRTVYDNVSFPLKGSNLTKEQKDKKVRDLLKLVELEEKASAYPSQLSGGQKQRVAIAGVMAMQPECIVLDEPTAMLDPVGRKEVLEAVHALNREKGVTIILITHYMEEVVEADHVYVMDAGKVVMQGTPRSIFSQVERLKEYRLDVPQITLLAYELKKAGLDIPDGILTREELTEALEKLCQS